MPSAEMTVLRWSLDEACDALTDADLDRRVGLAYGCPAVVVSCGDDAGEAVAERLTELPVVTIAIGRGGPGWDLVTSDPDPLVAGILSRPRAAVVACQVLRATAASTAPEGLFVESLAYAALQGGPEFGAWLAGRGRRTRPDEHEQRVLTVDRGDKVDVVLSRPRLKNLMDARMRDQLVDALRALVAGDDGRPVTIRGEGRDFCAGGDPAEFGSVSDPTTAHLIRSSANVAPWLLALAGRLEARVDGACVGAGVELAAFCDHVIASPGARFRLPELSMGLIPGAGGTVSIPRRIGRQRTLNWLVTNRELSAEGALDWGLVDELTDG